MRCCQLTAELCAHVNGSVPLFVVVCIFVYVRVKATFLQSEETDKTRASPLAWQSIAWQRTSNTQQALLQGQATGADTQTRTGWKHTLKSAFRFL